MLSSFASSAFSNAASVACAGDSVRKTSVLPHHTITSRSQSFSFLNRRMSSINWSARSFFVLPLLDVRSVEPLDVAAIEHGRHRLDRFELRLDLFEQTRLRAHRRSSPPRRRCPRKCPSAPNTTSSSDASGTKSLISGDRPSVRFPSRIVPICVKDPMGGASPRRTASTPAMVVVLDGAHPTSRMPSFPVASAIFGGFFTTGNYIIRSSPGPAPDEERDEVVATA